MLSWRINIAVNSLKQGGIIAYPTEAVWGLSCDPGNYAAVQRLLGLKNRLMEKGLILIAAEKAQFHPLIANLPPEQIKRLDDTWPGPYTWLVPDPKDQVPYWVKGKHEKVALRVSDQSLTQQICKKFGGPLVSTSANVSNRPAAKNRLKLSQAFAGEVDCILPGNLGSLSKPTQIADLSSGFIIRKG